MQIKMYSLAKKKKQHQNEIVVDTNGACPFENKTNVRCLFQLFGNPKNINSLPAL